MLDVIKCENCDKDLCRYGFFSCDCDEVQLDNKCTLCSSSGYDCEVAGCFTIECHMEGSNDDRV